MITVKDAIKTNDNTSQPFIHPSAYGLLEGYILIMSLCISQVMLVQPH